jgi:hypothetical protein
MASDARARAVAETEPEGVAPALLASPQPVASSATISDEIDNDDRRANAVEFAERSAWPTLHALQNWTRTWTAALA